MKISKKFNHFVYFIIIKFSKYHILKFESKYFYY